jgi:hypothetical protein
MKKKKKQQYYYRKAEHEDHAPHVRETEEMLTRGGDWMAEWAIISKLASVCTYFFI